MGVNAIQTYAMWSLHEPFRPGAFDFSGPLDLEAFLDAAAAEGLWVLLRPGPYVCAEVDAGGLPWWLHDPSVPGAGPEMKPRTADPDFLGFVDAWWGKLLPMMRPRLAANGGNVLMVQMENEYGSFNSEFLSFFLYFWERDRERWGRGLEGRERKRERERESVRKRGKEKNSDRRLKREREKKTLKNFFKTASCGTDSEGEYLRHLISTARTHLGDDVLFYTTDPPGVAKHGSLPGKEVLTLVDYGERVFFFYFFFRFFFIFFFFSSKTKTKTHSFFPTTTTTTTPSTQKKPLSQDQASTPPGPSPRPTSSTPPGTAPLSTRSFTPGG